MIKRRLIKALKLLLPKKYYDEIYFHRILDRNNFKLLNFSKILWCSVHGFLPSEYLWYDLEKNNYKDYLPARSNMQKRIINGSYNAILANKILFETHLKNVLKGIDKMNVITSIGYIEKGVLKPLHHNIEHGNFFTLKPFFAKKEIFLKPNHGDGGVGIILIRKSDDHYLLNNEKISWDELIERLSRLDDYIIQEKITQTGFSNEIYSGTVNTMRIATMIDPVSGKPFIPYAFHRFGSSKSQFIDNINQGGLISLIDVNDGSLSKIIYLTPEGMKQQFDDHPITSKKVANEKVPGWPDIVSRMLKMAEKMPYLKYAGWDVILSGNELFILEGNVSPSTGFQLFKPMKEFPSAWSFFKHHKYVN